MKKNHLASLFLYFAFGVGQGMQEICFLLVFFASLLGTLRTETPVSMLLFRTAKHSKFQLNIVVDAQRPYHS